MFGCTRQGFCARIGIGRLLLLPVVVMGFVGCGGSDSRTVPPVVLTVSIAETVRLSPGETIYVPVMVVAPTETVTFSIVGLPAGVSASYKESESNPSGQMTLIANSSTAVGNYACTITVGSSGQTASTSFPLHVVAGN